MENIKLNLGCGNQTPKGWVNVDYSLGAQIFKIPLLSSFNRKIRLFNLDWDKDILIHDLRKKFPWSNNSVDIIYSSHTLEHLNKQEGYRFLQESYRVLKNNGIIRIIVPDLQAIISQYTRGEILAEELIDKLEVSYERPEDKYWKRLLTPFISFPHKCMYDTEALLRIMSEIGFECFRSKPLNSKIPDIENIELSSRTQQAVIIEGRKTATRSTNYQQFSETNHYNSTK